MALNNDNNNDCCKCTTPEYELILNEQGPQGKQGEKGEPGFTPIISVKDNTNSNYTLNILTQDGQITTPNLKANLPAGGATGQVLTKNSGEQDDCSWQNLPNATTETEGIARLATEADFETTEAAQASDNTIVTPALFNSELAKQTSKFVTTNTVQVIEANKTIFSNLQLPYYNPNQKGSIITNARINGVNIPIVEPYDLNGSFRIGAAKEGIYTAAQNGFDINNNIETGLQGVTYYEKGQKGKIIADFNIDEYVKAGDNVTINKTDTGITINATGGGEIPEDVALKSANQTFTGHNWFNGQVNFNSTVQFTNQQAEIPNLHSSNKIVGVNISLESAGQSFKFPCKKGTMSLSATSGDDAGTTAGLYITGAGINNKQRLLTEGDVSVLPQANATTLGSIKANPKSDEDTQAVNIDPATGLLYTKAGGGTIEYIDGGNAQTDEPAVLKASNVDLGIYPTNNIYSTNENITIDYNKFVDGTIVQNE